MTGTVLCGNKPQSVPVIFEPPCSNNYNKLPVGCHPVAVLIMHIHKCDIRIEELEVGRAT
jgi:hypothetical protein